MEIRNADPLNNGHAAIAVAVYLDEPLLDQPFIMEFAIRFKLNRRFAQRVMGTQLVGNVFTLLGTKKGGPLLVCMVVGREKGAVDAKDAITCVRTMLASVSQAENPAVMGPGLEATDPSRPAAERDFQALCRALKRHGYAGTIYDGLPKPDLLNISPTGLGVAEPDSDTHFVINPNGGLRPSIRPTLASLRGRKPR